MGWQAVILLSWLRGAAWRMTCDRWAGEWEHRNRLSGVRGVDFCEVRMVAFQSKSVLFLLFAKTSYFLILDSCFT